MRLSVTLCVSVAVFGLETAAAAAPPEYCYRTTEPRGAGTFPTDCPSNGDFQVYDKVPAGTQKEYESDGGLLCYPKCKPGYTGHAFLCWQDGCPTGFRDDGAFCAKPAWTHEYRGTSYLLASSCAADYARSAAGSTAAFTQSARRTAPSRCSRATFATPRAGRPRRTSVPRAPSTRSFAPRAAGRACPARKTTPACATGCASDCAPTRLSTGSVRSVG
jgi:hypothetical protein